MGDRTGISLLVRNISRRLRYMRGRMRTASVFAADRCRSGVCVRSTRCVTARQRSLTFGVSLAVLLLLLFRPEDIRKEFERYGDVRDVYIPKDYYTRCVLAARGLVDGSFLALNQLVLECV